MERQVQVGMQIERDVMIPMRDGTLMATDVYRPDNVDAAPLLLERTPYGKHLPSRSEITAADPSKALSREDVAARFVARGFAVAYQDTRGRYNSEGVFAKYLADGADGFDAVQALASLPGLDGRVGMFGLSYSAHTQVAAASMGPPALRALVVILVTFAWRTTVSVSFRTIITSFAITTGLAVTNFSRKFHKIFG